MKQIIAVYWLQYLCARHKVAVNSCSGFYSVTYFLWHFIMFSSAGCSLWCWLHSSNFCICIHSSVYLV